MLLDNPRSSRVRAVARLAQRKARQAAGLFLLEGPQAVTEALDCRPELVEELFVTPTALERFTAVAELVARTGTEPVFATEEVIESMADTVSPQGVVATCRLFPTAAKDILVPSATLVAVLEEVRDPGNAGTIIRAADAAGADGVVLTGRSVDLYNPKLIRSTVGSLFHLPVAQGVDLAKAASLASQAGLSLIAADVGGDDLLSVRAEGALRRPTAWLFGNEARGLSADDLLHADRAVRIPLYGRAESLNLATAASVCLYESAFELRAGGTVGSGGETPPAG